MKAIRKNGLVKLTRGPGPNGELGWYFDRDGRLVKGEFCENDYELAKDHVLRSLEYEGIGFDEVRYVTLGYENDSYTPVQFLRFADYFDWSYGYIGQITLVGDDFYMYVQSGMGLWWYEPCFKSKRRYKYRPFCGYHKFDPPARGTFGERWGFGDKFSEINHLWPSSDGMRDYSTDDIIDNALAAMRNMSQDSKAVPENLYMLSVPQCREPIIIRGRGGKECRGYLQAAFDTRVHVLTMRDAVFFEPLDLTEIFSREDLEEN